MSSEKGRSTARPSRAAEELVSRRDRGGNDNDLTANLAVPADRLDPNYHYRFVNDEPKRMMMLTEYDDYDPVGEDEIAGVKTDRFAQITRNGMDPSQMVRARLLRKPMALHKKHEREKHAKLDDEMASAAKGEKIISGPNGESGGVSLNDPNFYVAGKDQNAL